MLNKYIKVNSLSPYQKFPKPPIQIPVPLQNPLIHHSTTLQHPNIFILPLLNHPIHPFIHPLIHPLIHSSQIHPSFEGAHPIIQIYPFILFFLHPLPSDFRLLTSALRHPPSTPSLDPLYFFYTN